MGCVVRCVSVDVNWMQQSQYCAVCIDSNIGQMGWLVAGCCFPFEDMVKVHLSGLDTYNIARYSTTLHRDAE